MTQAGSRPVILSPPAPTSSSSKNSHKISSNDDTANAASKGDSLWVAVLIRRSFGVLKGPKWVLINYAGWVWTFLRPSYSSSLGKKISLCCAVPAMMMIGAGAPADRGRMQEICMDEILHSRLHRILQRKRLNITKCFKCTFKKPVAVISGWERRKYFLLGDPCHFGRGLTNCVTGKLRTYRLVNI